MLSTMPSADYRSGGEQVGIDGKLATGSTPEPGLQATKNLLIHNRLTEISTIAWLIIVSLCHLMS